jgi:precorrin-2 dehydrogenase/sirohydrochlorin ferrochelatase
MDAFPAFFSLTGKTVAIAGSGDLAEAKARLFANSPATIRRLFGAEALAADSYANCVLAFIADPDEAFCAAAAVAARQAGAPVNVTDRPALSDFSTPALIDRGAVVAAIGTGGASPVLATMLRGDIENLLPEGLGRLATLLHRLRDEVRQARPAMADRRDFLRRVLEGPAAEAAMAGRLEEAEQVLRQALAEPATARIGWIKILDGAAPVDLLSLRALRALSQADAVATDGAATPDSLARTRRDAPRIALEIADLIARAQGGGRVVCIVADPLALAAVLNNQDQTAQILPVAKA